MEDLARDDARMYRKVCKLAQHVVSVFNTFQGSSLQSEPASMFAHYTVQTQHISCNLANHKNDM